MCFFIYLKGTTHTGYNGALGGIPWRRLGVFLFDNNYMNFGKSVMFFLCYMNIIFEIDGARKVAII